MLSSPVSEGATPDTPPADPMNDPKMKRVRFIFLFVMPFLMVTMMYASYVGTMHAPTPKSMPVAIAGDGAANDRLANALGTAAGDKVDVREADSVSDAKSQLRHRDLAAAVVDPGGNKPITLITASGAGLQKTTQVQQIVQPVATAQGKQVVTQDVAPLPVNDASGTAAMFAGMGLMMAGYIPLSLMVMGAPYLLRVRRFLPILGGWSVLVTGVIWTILGPILGAIDGHFLEFMGLGILTVCAVGSVQFLFTKFMGPMAVLVGMLFLIALGMPASGLAYPLESMPGFFGFLHNVLPLAAAGESIRSMLYFDNIGIWPHVVTLGIGLVVAIGLAALRERKSGDAIPAAPPVESEDDHIPGLAGGKPRPKHHRHLLIAAFPLSIIVMMVGLMGFSMHKTDLHHMPVSVVGATEAQAQKAVAGMQKGLGDKVDLSVATSVRDANAKVKDRTSAGTYVLPGVDGARQAKLYTASGAGFAQARSVTSIFTPIAQQQKVPLQQSDLMPLTKHDTMGINSMYGSMAWIMAGFLIMAVFRGGAPELRTTRQLLPFLGGWAVGISVWLWFLFDVLIGAVNGHALALIGLGTLTVFSVSMVAGVLTRTIGLFGIVPLVGVLMLAGVPSSGGGMSIYMVPELFQPLKDILPLPAAVDALRAVTYFDGHGLGKNILVLAIWGLAGLLGNILIDLRGARRADPDTIPPGGSGGTDDEGDATDEPGVADDDLQEFEDEFKDSRPEDLEPVR